MASYGLPDTGYAQGYATMMNALGQNTDRNARLGQFLQDEPLKREQQMAETQAQQFQNQNAPTMMQAKLMGTPFEQSQAAQEHARQLLQMQMQQQNVQRQQQHEEAIERRYADMARHNLQTEDVARLNEQTKARIADPFGEYSNPATGAPAATGQTATTPQQGMPQPQGAQPQAGYDPVKLKQENPSWNVDALNMMPVKKRAVVQGMLDGEIQAPTGQALRNPMTLGLIASAREIDPHFDTTVWGARAQTRKSFSPGGKDMTNLNSINTVIGHIGTLDQAATALNNSSVQGVNTFVNGIQNYFGDPRITTFETAKNAVGNDLMRTFQGVGAGSEHEIQAWKKIFDSSSSPEKLKAAIHTAAELLDSRIQTMNHAYEQGMGKQRDVLQMVYPHSRAALDQISGKASQASPEGAAAGTEQYPTATAPNGRKAMFKDGKWQTMP